jgi:hypothetical protein
MSRSNLRNPWPIHFKFHRVIGIDGLTVCILYGEISIFHSRALGLYSSNCRQFFICRAVNWEPLGQFTSNFAQLLELIVLQSVYFWWNFDFSFQSYGTLFIKLSAIFRMSRCKLRTSWPIHFKLRIVIGIDSLMVCILFGEISILHSRVMRKKVFTNIVWMLTMGVSCALGAAVYFSCVELRSFLSWHEIEGKWLEQILFLCGN